VNESDESLYARWIGGDLRAFDALYARYERALFGFVRAFVRAPSEAEDVMHEAFMAVLRERRKGIQSFRAWMYEVTRHLCLNRARSKKRAARALEEVKTIEGEVPGRASVENEIDARRRAIVLERAVTRLPEAFAEVYRLRASGMSYDEVADVLGVPIGTVKSRMHEMVLRLREEVSR
jgi:RNA polymerase sigma-70 factor (ECF subfamily)